MNLTRCWFGWLLESAKQPWQNDHIEHVFSGYVYCPIIRALYDHFARAVLQTATVNRINTELEPFGLRIFETFPEKLTIIEMNGAKNFDAILYLSVGRKWKKRRLTNACSRWTTEAERYVWGMIMSLVARLIVMKEQLKSKKPKVCNRCSLPYDPKQTNCPHCTGLTDRQIEELKGDNKKVQYGNIVYIILVFSGLAFLFALMSWLK